MPPLAASATAPASADSAAVCEHALLLLPFTPALLADPAPVLPTLFLAAQRAATRTLTVVFSTPAACHDGRQVYVSLREAPRVHWAAFGAFLGRAYSALAAGQWAADRVLLDVEVRFDGEEGDWALKVLAAPERVFVLEGFEEIGAHIAAAAAAGAPREHLPAPAGGLDLCGTVAGPPPPAPGYLVAALGGTFDHLHAAHKLLINVALFVTEERLVCGVVTDAMLQSKSNAALVQPLSERLAGCTDFLLRCGAGARDVTLDVVEILDALGPTGWDAEIEALVVSRETMTGGLEVNRVRAAKHLCTLEILAIDVISSNVEGDSATFRTVDLAAADDKDLKELKMGSTAIRAWMAENVGAVDA